MSISKAAGMLGVSISTLRRWDASGKLKAERTPTGHRRYRESQVAALVTGTAGQGAGEPPTVAYARVSPKGRKRDLADQAETLAAYCSAQGWGFRVIEDAGDAPDWPGPGMRELLDLIVGGGVPRVVVTHKDRLLGLGSETVLAVCEAAGVEVVILNKGRSPDFEAVLAEDLLALADDMAARLYGQRSGAADRLIGRLRETASELDG